MTNLTRLYALFCYIVLVNVDPVDPDTQLSISLKQIWDKCDHIQRDQEFAPITNNGLVWRLSVLGVR
jgi:hypothetical protein